MQKKKQEQSQQKEKARQLNFYAAILDNTDKVILEHAAELEGLSEEIAMVRFKLRDVMANYPDNVRLALDTANTLARLLNIQHDITKEQKKSLKEAITKVITEIAVPLGVKILFK